MAAVSSAAIVGNAYNPPSLDKPRPRSPAGFTAVNGRDNPTSIATVPNTGPGDTIVVSSDRHENRPSHAPASRTASPSRHTDSLAPREKDSLDQPSKQHPPLASLPTQESLTSHKRKRSSSGSEDSTSSLSTSQLSPPRRASMPLKTVDQSAQSSNVADVSQAHARPATQSPSGTGYSAQPDMKGERRHSVKEDEWSDKYGRRASSTQHDHDTDRAEAKMAEVLQEGMRGDDLSGQQRPWNAAGRLDTETSDAENTQYGQYGNDGSGQATSQVGKRKRVFSNRTKTGCMTCRKRKKKCDEGHPSCNNCVKGGFVCAGYSTRNAWHKNGASKPPIPLQAKEGFIETSEHGQTAHHHYMNGRGSPGPRRDSLHPEGAKVQPIVVEDNENPPPQYSVDNPPNAPRPPRPPFQSWGPNGHAAIPEMPRKAEYQRLPQLHDIPQGERNSVNNIPPISHLEQSAGAGAPAPTFGGQWQSIGGPRYSSFPPHHYSHNSPKGTAQLALSLTDQQRDTRNVAPETVERQKMVTGEIFRYTDHVLSRDRENCRRRLFQLNKTGEAFVCDSHERQRDSWDLFKKLFSLPQDANTGSPVTMISNFRPGIEPGAMIEPGFKCTFGYNIFIGEDVYIGDNCNIIDVCPVKLGSRTWIGHNVTIISGQAHSGPQQRQGANSPWIGRPVEIGVGAWIGHGAMIYAGVTIPSGCYIESGAVVKCSLTKGWETVGERPAYEF